MSNNKCQGCGAECTNSCAHCKKVNYCSKACQKTDWKAHKRVCYPAELVKGGPYDSYYFRTTRDIEPNELIFADPVVIIAPPDLRAIGLEYMPICLACYRKCSESCAKCHWPVCGFECQEDPGHKLKECPILVQGDINGGSFLQECFPVGEYILIAIIRILLLKKNDPVTWDLIMKLEPALSTKNLRGKGLTMEEKKMQDFGITHIFQSYLGFRHVTAAEMTHARDIWRDFAKGPEPNQKLDDRMFCMLNPFFRLHSQTCTKNTKHFLMGNTLDKLNFRTYATTKIPAGSPLKSFPLQAYLMYGTLARRAEIFENYGIWCNCDRCKDATENGSYLSALKCPDHCNTNTDAYLLPMDPLNPESKWNCTNRNCKTIYKSSTIHKILQPIQKKFDEFMKRASERHFESIMMRKNMDFENVDRILINEMLKYDEELMKTLHRNHYIRFNLRKLILYGTGITITDGVRKQTKIQKEMIRNLKSMEEFIDRMYEMAQQCAPIVQCILPGYSKFYGEMQFFIAISQHLVVGKNLILGGSEGETKEALAEFIEASAITMKCFSDGVSEIKDLPEINLQHILPLKNFKRSILEIAEIHKPKFSLDLSDLKSG